MRTRWWHLPLLLLVVTPLFALFKWGSDAKGVWGPPVDGVQARLVSRRTLWRSGEEMELTLALRSKRAVAWTMPGDIPLTLNASSEAGSVGHLSLMLELPPGGLTLAPGQRMTLPHVLLPTTGWEADWYEVSGSAGGFVLRPVHVRILEARKPRSPRS